MNSFVAKLFRVNLQEERYFFLILVFFIIIMVGVLVYALDNLQVTQHLNIVESDRWIGVFAQINATLVAIGLAVTTYMMHNKELEQCHAAIISGTCREITFLGLFLCAADCCTLPFKDVDGRICLALLLGQGVFFLLTIGGYATIMDKDWKETVLKNTNKEKETQEAQKRFLVFYREFSVLLENNSESTSFYTQVEQLAESCNLTAEECRFLKRLNDLVDETKTGKRIKDPDLQFNRLKAIISKLPQDVYGGLIA